MPVASTVIFQRYRKRGRDRPGDTNCERPSMLRRWASTRRAGSWWHCSTGVGGFGVSTDIGCADTLVASGVTDIS